MYFHIVRLSANHQVIPIGLSEWEAFVEQQENFYWADTANHSKNEAIYFINTQDEQGMDWFLREDGTFKFKNTKLSLEHPYIQKISEVAEALDAQVIKGDILINKFDPGETIVPSTNCIPAVLPTTDQTKVVSSSSPEILDVKVKSIRKLSYQAKAQLKPPPAIKKIVLHTQETELRLGNSFQGDLIVPFEHPSTKENGPYFRIRNIWLSIIKVQENTYTFEVETSFVVEANQDHFFYKEKSKIMANRSIIEV